MRYILEDTIDFPQGYFYVILRDRVLDTTVCYLGHYDLDRLLKVIEDDKDLMYIKREIADKFEIMKRMYQERIVGE